MTTKMYFKILPLKYLTTLTLDSSNILLTLIDKLHCTLRSLSEVLYQTYKMALIYSRSSLEVQHATTAAFEIPFEPPSIVSLLLINLKQLFTASDMAGPCTSFSNNCEI